MSETPAWLFGEFIMRSRIYKRLGMTKQMFYKKLHNKPNESGVNKRPNKVLKTFTEAELAELEAIRIEILNSLQL